MKIFPFSRFIVYDNSMIPSYYPGDHVLTFKWIAPQKNSTIVFKKADKFLLKRIIRVEGKNFICCGDNRKYSKTNYKVRLEDITGEVVFKY